ncbi:ankyrin repeat and MYND domain-containing protein 1-like [Corythoichthys intestinalis]|uniref:ankyrin repeat and MYND domain-containing protein 1-like n=1 Tax=Corythoichthys intestinalis TaxID=161448 RepID=UPI0025A62292|nr:ankyrin repeat and MYND domain-containing protein 1-like [Corythoichthys intestinalis]
MSNCLKSQRSPRREVGKAKRQGFCVQEFLDGSKYEGEFVDGLKQGKGKYTWKNGEFYEGSFYKDYRHGDGMYYWPSGNKFYGKFYLNWREGYGKHIFPDGAIFKGLYHADQRFGPGVLTAPYGCQDVGIWHGKHLIQLCNTVEGSFRLEEFTEYSVDLEQTTTSNLSETPQTVLSEGYTKTDSGADRDDHLLLYDDNTILPSAFENYSTDIDHLPLPPHVRREFDQNFFGQLWEPDSHLDEGYKQDPSSVQPLPAKMLAHIHKHRQQAKTIDWPVANVLSCKRDFFGPKGPLEIASELLIHQASIGERQTVLQILLDGCVHPDVADSQGHTALIAATIHCQNDVINLLLDMGAYIDRLNSEGMSCLSVCHVLYYPIKCLCTFSALQEETEDIIERLPDEELTLPDDYNRGNEENIQSLEGSNQLDNELTSEPYFSSSCSMYSYDIEVSEKLLEVAAEALSHTGFPQQSDTEETVRKMAAKKFMHRFRLSTLNLLLDRGANPNISKVPLPVLFVAIMARDTETVRRLLLSGAHTDIALSLERKGHYPLHVAATLPGPESPKIIEMLLHALSDPDARASDQNESYELDKVSIIIRRLCRVPWEPSPKEGGRTALHIVCQRETDHMNACEAVSVLLSHRARTDLLWSGHSPLSLAISTGNEMAVQELLKGGADPNIPLGLGVGNALCALSNFSYNLDDKREKLLDMLEKAGADMLMPVQIGDTKGTAVDYAHFSFNQDSHIAKIPFHRLSMEERETFKARRNLLTLMGDLLRCKAVKREKEILESEAASSKVPMTRIPFQFCYHCGRSATVTLTACTRCHQVLFCSTNCKLKSWNKGHKEECIQAVAEQIKLEQKKMTHCSKPDKSKEWPAGFIRHEGLFNTCPIKKKKSK